MFFAENNSREVTRQFNPFPLDDETARKITHEARNDLYFIAFHDEKIVGLCMLRGMDLGYDAPSFGVLVHREHRGHGLGTKMTRFALQQALKLGFKRVRLSVYSSNQEAMRLYSFIGFKEVSREKVSVRGENDEKVVMVKELFKTDD